VSDSASELTSEQVSEMCWADNPNTGLTIKLNRTPELEADYREWLGGECVCSVIELTRVILKNGTELIREQCKACGRPVKTPVKRSSVSNIEQLETASIDRLFEYEADRRSTLRKIRDKHAAVQLRPGWGSSEYQEYLKSEKWKQKRDAVMRRANGICEGCGMTDASVVHHHHYRNIYEEWLWELVALCRPCHDQCHPERRNGDD
jgi:5-methylcytosine-specific restriction endonuclease McrA